MEVFVVLAGCSDDFDDCTRLVGVYTLPGLAETAVSRDFNGEQYHMGLTWSPDRMNACTPDRYYFYEIKLVKVDADAVLAS